MQGDSDIIAILDSAIESLTQGDRKAYNFGISRVIDEIGRAKTYRYLHSSLLREAQKAEGLASTTISTRLRQERADKAKMLRDEARIFASISRDPRKPASPQSAAEH